MTKFTAKEWQCVMNQFSAVFTVNLISLMQGVTVAWLSPYLPLLQSEDSPLTSGPVTTEEASWIGALLSAGGFVGSFLFNFIIEQYGKKIGFILLALPQIGFWLNVIFGNTVKFLYFARFLLGLTGGGMVIVIPLYVADISEKQIRGIMGSMFTFITNIGYLIGYILGHFLPYKTVSWIMLPCPLIFALSMIFLPETPYCLLRKNMTKEAEKSLMFYRGIISESKKTAEFQTEFQNSIKMVECEKTTTKDAKLSLNDFCKKPVLKGLAIGVFLMIINEMSGYFAILQYASTIFIESGSTLTPNESTIVVGFLQIVGTFVSFFVVDRYGRKIILIISTFGTGIGLLAIATYSFMNMTGFNLKGFGWVPVTSLSFAIFIVNLGLVGIPFFILPEIIPKKVLSIGNVICMTTYNFTSFTVLKTTPIMIESIKLYGTMWIFAGVCFIGTLIMLIFLPETKGKDLLIVEHNTDKDKGIDKNKTIA